MTLPEALELFEYWQSSPPEHEMLAMFARTYTTWKPQAERLPPEDEHRRSLEERWKAGAMNPKQLFESMGGAISLNAVPGQGMTGAQMPGIGPFPGAH
jgi:hypothetical protein